MKLPTINAADLGRVVVLMGGTSAEREISLLSGQGVLAALKTQGVDAVAFDPAQGSIAELQAIDANIAMICLHGRGGEDGCIQGMLETIGLPYTGSGVMSSAIAMDKTMTKRLWLAQGLPTPAYRLVNTLDAMQKACHDLGLGQGKTLAVKPAKEGSSLGFTHVTSTQDIESAWNKASLLADDILVETFVSGTELTVAVLTQDGQTHALPIVEIIAPAGNYDYQNKYFKDDTRYVCPAQLPQTVTEQVQQLAQAAFDSIGCTGWGRVDIMLSSADQQPYLLEVNTAPGMTSHSLVPMAAQAMGIDYASLCCLIAASARLKN